MPKRPAILASIAALLCCAAGWISPVAAQVPNIMIVGEDADRDTVPCDSRVFAAVRRQVIDQLDQEGYNVFDETAAIVPDFEPGRCRRSEAELIDTLRAVTRPPLDVAVLIRMYSMVEELAYTAKVHARITGRMLNVKTGQDLGGFEVRAPEEWTMRVDCAADRACLLEDMARYAGILAKDLGAVLAVKLDGLTGGATSPIAASDARDTADCMHNAYTIVFDGYTAADVRIAEEYLVAFQDYRRHRASGASPRRRTYWYESCIEPARLTRNFAEMFKFMNTPSRIDFSPSRNTFTLTKIPLRKER